MSERPTSEEDANFINDQVKAGKITAQEAATMDVDKYKKVEESWKPADIKMQGKDVHICGAMHTPATLEFHERDLENSIKDSSIVALEISPTAMGFFDDSTLTFFESNALLNGKKITAAEWNSYFSHNETINYYQQIEKLAAKHNKSVAQVDASPETDQTIFPEAVLQSNKDSVPNLKFIAIMISQTCGAEVLANQKREAGPAAQSNFDKWDYRDAFTTQGLEVLAKKVEASGPVVLAIGDDHVEAIVNYAKTPEARAVKTDLYLANEQNFRKPKLQIFQPVPSGKWEQTEKIGIV